MSVSGPEDALRQLREQIAARIETTQRREPPDGDVVSEALHRAAQRADVGIALPSFDHLGPLRRFVARRIGRLLLYLLQLVASDQRQFNRLVLRALQELDRQMRQFRQDDAAQTAQLSQLGTRLEILDARSGQHSALADKVRRISDQQTHLVALEAGPRLQALESAVSERDQWFADLAARNQSVEQAVADIRQTAAYLRGRINERNQAIDALLSQTEALLSGTHESARVAMSGTASLHLEPPPPDSVFDTWAFVEAFRGSEDRLREQQRRYLPYFVGRAPVLDVGCGRGEFLEVLREAGVVAHGVDLSGEMVLRCREKELDVVKADALSHLKALPDTSLGGVFCSQVIEHLEASATLALLKLMYAKLRPNGVAVIETLNPECLLVHYRWFWMDPTHVRLVHPETLKFLLVSVGFRDLEGRYFPARERATEIPPLSIPGADPIAIEQFNAGTAHLHALLHGSPDYALIARR